jgi:hypothetical protein
VEYNNEEAGAEWLQRLTHGYPQIRVDQPRTLGCVAIPPKHQQHLADGQQPHISADPQGLGRRHTHAEQITPWLAAYNLK